MRLILVAIWIVFSLSVVYAQDYQSLIIRNDTLAEVGRSVRYNDGSIYLNGSLRCALVLLVPKAAGGIAQVKVIHSEQVLKM